MVASEPRFLRCIAPSIYLVSWIRVFASLSLLSHSLMHTFIHDCELLLDRSCLLGIIIICAAYCCSLCVQYCTCHGRSMADGHCRLSVKGAKKGLAANLLFIVIIHPHSHSSSSVLFQSHSIAFLSPLFSTVLFLLHPCVFLHSVLSSLAVAHVFMAGSSHFAIDDLAALKSLSASTPPPSRATTTTSAPSSAAATSHGMMEEAEGRQEL